MNSQHKQKFLAAVLTILLLAIFFLALNSVAVPHHDLIAERYDDINWTRFIPQPPQALTKEHASESKVKNPQEILKKPRVERINLDDLLPEMNEAQHSLAPITAQSEKVRSRQQSKSANPKMMELDEELLTGELNLIPGEEAAIPISAQRTRGRTAGTGLTLGEETGASVSGNDSVGNVSAGLKKPVSGHSSAPPSRQIVLKSLNELGNEMGNLSPIYRPLVEWMKKHPHKLPGVVQRFMGYAPPNLTSMVHFTVNGNSYQMYLLCVESAYEVRIALIKGEQVIYLIDQGFRNNVNLLRTGTITRLKNGKILEFSTNLQPAGNQVSKGFYQIFLSWWETVENEK